MVERETTDAPLGLCFDWADVPRGLRPGAPGLHPRLSPFATPRRPRPTGALAAARAARARRCRFGTGSRCAPARPRSRFVRRAHSYVSTFPRSRVSTISSKVRQVSRHANRPAAPRSCSFDPVPFFMEGATTSALLARRKPRVLSPLHSYPRPIVAAAPGRSLGIVGYWRPPRRIGARGALAVAFLQDCQQGVVKRENVSNLRPAG